MATQEIDDQTLENAPRDLLQAAEAGDVDAQRQLGWWYANTSEEKDADKESREWYLKAAETKQYEFLF